MKSSLTYRLLSIATVGASISVLTPNAFADDLMVNGLKSSNITIDKVDGDKILYKTQSGSPSDKSINDKLQLVIADEPNLATAEDAFIKLKYSDAVDGYQKVLRSTSKLWLKDYAAFRLVKSGEKADRFDAVVTGYLVILQKNPTFAKEMKLNIPTDPKNSYLATAAKQIDAAITATKDPAISSSLVSFRMTIAKSMGDQAKVLELANVLTKGANSGNPTNVDATTLSNIVEGNISLITASVEKKDYAAALKSLEACKPSVVEQKHQIEWLWLNAVATEGQLGDSKDPVKLKDTAIEYLKISANFASTPRAGEALIRAAKIMEKLSDTKSATALYTQVEREFRGQPVATEAKNNLTRLSGK